MDRNDLKNRIRKELAVPNLSYSDIELQTETIPRMDGQVFENYHTEMSHLRQDSKTTLNHKDQNALKFSSGKVQPLQTELSTKDQGTDIPDFCNSN